MKNKEIPQSKIETVQGKKEEKKEKKEREKRKVGRPTILTPELKSKLIKLFEEHFFIAVVAGSGKLSRPLFYTQRINGLNNN